MTGFTLDEAKQIIDKSAVVFCARWDENDPRFVVATELYRRAIAKYSEEGFTISKCEVASMAFAIGRAVGVREERARRRGEKLEPLPQAEIDKAKEAMVCQRERDGYIDIIKGLDDDSKRLLLDYLKQLEEQPA